MKSSTVNSPDMQIIQLDIKQLSKISSGANPHQQLVALGHYRASYRLESPRKLVRVRLAYTWKPQLDIEILEHQINM